MTTLPTLLLCILYWHGLAGHCAEPYPPVVDEYHGYLSYYAPNVMEAVISYRQTGATYRSLPSELPDVDGYAAVLHGNHVGSHAIITRPNTAIRYCVLITDYAAPTTVPWMLTTPYAAEVDYPLWQRLGPGWINITIVPKCHPMQARKNASRVMIPTPTPQPTTPQPITTA